MCQVLYPGRRKPHKFCGGDTKTKEGLSPSRPSLTKQLQDSYNQYMFTSSFTLPERRTWLIFCGIFCLLVSALFFVFPNLLGWLVAVLLGAGGLPQFWAEHPALYAALQTAVRLFYVLCVTAVLDFSILFFSYKLLNDLVTRENISPLDLCRVTLRAGIRLLGWQAAAALAVCIFCGWQDNFSVYSLLPVFFSSSFSGSMWTILWEISAVCFAIGFAAEESALGGLRLAWHLFVMRLPFWLLVLAAALLFIWGPAALLAAFGMQGGGFVSVVFTLWGAFTHFLLLSGSWIYLFNQPDLFPAE